MDFTELDNWLGTLEELQLGLDSKNLSSDSSRYPTSSANAHFNRTFHPEPSSPRMYGLPPRTQPAHINPLSTEGPSPVHSFPTPISTSNLMQSSNSTHRLTQNHVENDVLCTFSHCNSHGHMQGTEAVRERPMKDEAAEYGLNTLLKDLEAVEERMRKLEQGSDTFTRRYSLASSPPLTRATRISSTQASATPSTTISTSSAITSAPQFTQNGYISAQWVAELNREVKCENTGSITNCPIKANIPTSSDIFSSPPAWLGAGDACVSPTNSPQPNTPSTKLLEQTEVGLWCLSQGHQRPRPSPDHSLQSSDETYLPAASKLNGISHTTLSSVEMPKSNCLSKPGIVNGQGHKQHMNEVTSKPVHQAAFYPEDGNLPQSVVSRPLPNPECSSHIRINLPADESESAHRPAVHKCSGKQYGIPPHGEDVKDMDDDSSLSGISSWSPGPNSAKRDMTKSNSLACPVPDIRLSNSFSRDSSLSEKSLPDHLDSSSNTQFPRNMIEGSAVKKLVIRIFRPDKTTKAILIDENMSAGEVANVLIEKNFLQPSIKLVLVEKVPALKVERIFEEHENVADCILAWSTTSQNMLFFEERDDQYGFIESPGVWFGDDADETQHKNSKTVQAMLKDIEQVGFPEWRDHLYVRKPNDKTWTRRFCVLRSSGMYTSRKNKLPLSSSDLKRIVPLDGHLQLYTTTGGWTRSHAPTPHGFALKPYSAQDAVSDNVYCFCATDEKNFRQWICRIRMAKFGKQLYINYQHAVKRVENLDILRRPPFSSHLTANGSSNACLQRKSSFDIRPSYCGQTAFTPVGSARSLSMGVTFSPSAVRRPTTARSSTNQRTVQSALRQF